MSQIIRNATTNILIGDFMKSSRKFTSKDVGEFARLTGDFNRVHFEPDPQRQFKKPIVHGMLTASLIPTTVAKALPGSIYLEQTLQFKKPVYIDDELEALITVTDFRRIGNKKGYLMVCRTEIKTSVELVVDGVAKVLIPGDDDVRSERSDVGVN